MSQADVFHERCEAVLNWIFWGKDVSSTKLTARGTPYSMKAFYWHWYRHYEALKNKCPVRFSVHDIRHLFVSEYLIALKLACGGGTDHFDSEQYLREREAFGSQIMGWRSSRTIDIYDQSVRRIGAYGISA